MNFSVTLEHGSVLFLPLEIGKLAVLNIFQNVTQKRWERTKILTNNCNMLPITQLNIDVSNGTAIAITISYMEIRCLPTYQEWYKRT